MKERLMEIGRRTVIVRGAEGEPMLRIKALHAAILAGVAVTTTPRVTAAVALAMLFKGISLDVEDEAAA